MQNSLRGLIAAPVTPFRPNGDVNLEGIGRQADGVAPDGISAAFVAGTTGEGMSLTMAERFAVAEERKRLAPA